MHLRIGVMYLKENIVRVFIGSSKEGKEYAEVLQALIDENCESTIWNQGIFKPGITTIESLNEELNNFDLAIFIFTPDDEVISRREKKVSIRDNLIFELGLAMGKLGYGRAIFVLPKDIDIKIPTDLLGITSLQFNSERLDGNLQAAMGIVAMGIKDIVKSIKKENRTLKINQKDRCQLEKINLKMDDLIGRLIDCSGRGYNTIIFLDIDKMRNIKEIYGDTIADKITKEVESIIYGVCKEQLAWYYVSHIYTDSFTVILPESQIKNIPNDIINAINIYDWGSICIGLFLHASIGIAIKEDDESYENWMKRAIHSCRMAKMEGGNRVGEEISFVPPIYRKINLFDQFSS